MSTSCSSPAWVRPWPVWAEASGRVHLAGRQAAQFRHRGGIAFCRANSAFHLGAIDGRRAILFGCGVQVRLAQQVEDAAHV